MNGIRSLAERLAETASFEVVKEWFAKCRDRARQAGRPDSAALWDDGLTHLLASANRAETLERALTQLAFMARTSGTPTPELLREGEGAEALIVKTGELHG